MATLFPWVADTGWPLSLSKPNGWQNGGKIAQKGAKWRLFREKALNQPGLHRSSDSERIEPLIGFHEDILRQLFARLTIAENRRGTPPLHSPKRCVVIGFRVG
ncbi:MAG: hypothetical protein ACLQU5_02655 [Isosphaeraceae bacterium]